MFNNNNSNKSNEDLKRIQEDMKKINEKNQNIDFTFSAEKNKTDEYELETIIS